MKSKLFILLILVFSLSLSAVLALVNKHSLDLNPLNIISQKRIIDSNEQSKVVFVGDSSLGNGLDEKYFSDLLGGTSVTNLHLTAGGHNFSGTYNMIRHTIENNKDVKYIIIMQSPLSWYREFIESGYCSTLGNLDIQDALAYEFIDSYSCFRSRYLNVKSFYETSLQINAMNNKKNMTNPKTYKNGGKDIFKEMSSNQHSRLNVIGSTKNTEIMMIDNYISDKKVKVLYVQGSLHYQLSEKYREAIFKQHKILSSMKNITFIEKHLYPKSINMGDTESHVDIDYKLSSTKFYYDILQQYLDVR